MPTSISVTGSTMVTPFALIEAYSIKDILAANAPYALSPVPGPKVRDNTSLFTKLFGVRSVPDLGTLTTCMSGSVDTPIVQRSWGLLGYGPNFRFGEYMKVRNSFQGIAMHLGLAVLPLLLILPFASIFAKIFLPPPGAGPTKELGSKDRLKFRGLGMPDVAAPNPPRALINGVIEGSVYACRSPGSRSWFKLIPRSYWCHRGRGGDDDPSRRPQAFWGYSHTRESWATVH
jgi:hypothetical protein